MAIMCTQTTVVGECCTHRLFCFINIIINTSYFFRNSILLVSSDLPLSFTRHHYHCCNKLFGPDRTDKATSRNRIQKTQFINGTVLGGLAQVRDVRNYWSNATNLYSMKELMTKKKMSHTQTIFGQTMLRWARSMTEKDDIDGCTVHLNFTLVWSTRRQDETRMKNDVADCFDSSLIY